MASFDAYQALEFKNYTLSGPLMDQLVGTALRARYRMRPALLTDVIVVCRGVSSEARSRARELEAELNLRISFKVIP